MGEGRGLRAVAVLVCLVGSGCLAVEPPTAPPLALGAEESSMRWSRFFLNITEPGPVAYLLKFRVEGNGPCIAVRDFAINKRGPGPFLFYQLAATTGSTIAGPSFQSAFGNGVDPSVHFSDLAVDTRSGNYAPGRTEGRGRTALGTDASEFRLMEVLVAWAPGVVEPSAKPSFFRLDATCGKVLHFEGGYRTNRTALFSLGVMTGGSGATTPVGSVVLGDRGALVTTGATPMLRVMGYSGVGRVEVQTPKATETIPVNGYWEMSKEDGPGRYAIHVREYGGAGAALWAGIYDFDKASAVDVLPIEPIHT